jgi:hypothetical protein
MRTRDEVYLAMLSHGLSNIRVAAWGGNAAYCGIEADHLHNVPSLIGEANEARHEYYLGAERSCYLNSLARIKSRDFDGIVQFYSPLWAELELHLQAARTKAGAHQ